LSFQWWLGLITYRVGANSLSQRNRARSDGRADSLPPGSPTTRSMPSTLSPPISAHTRPHSLLATHPNLNDSPRPHSKTHRRRASLPFRPVLANTALLLTGPSFSDAAFQQNAVPLGRHQLSTRNYHAWERDEKRPKPKKWYRSASSSGTFDELANTRPRGTAAW
jgi:hypothetical protein